MAYIKKKFYYREDDTPAELLAVYRGFSILDTHPLFSNLHGQIYTKTSHLKGKDSIACVTKTGDVFLNSLSRLSAEEWAYAIAHSLLHLAFGHFDQDKIPKDQIFYPQVWAKACDIYNVRYLADACFGKSLFEDPALKYPIKLNDEIKIYEYLLKNEGMRPTQDYGLNALDSVDLIGIEDPITYKKGEENGYARAFVSGIFHSARSAVRIAGGHDRDKEKDTDITRAAEWFLAHYPLLGGLAASFKIIEDVEMCHKYEIHIAAVDVEHGEILANPSCGLTYEEWIFVLAHEYLHAGLCHHERCQGRDPIIWNIAADFAINDWLYDLKIGDMPDEVLYDKSLHNMSAEAIYDLIINEMKIRKFKKYATFRGYGKGDIIGRSGPHFEGMDKGISLDDLFKNSLREGLDYHLAHERGYLPAGLVEEIRALTMPPIPWDVELGKWFDELFPPVEKHRTYARPSRRQGSTPDIPRPRYVIQDKDTESRTFGVVIDTSGSMCSSQIGLALGAIASYAVSKDVPFARIVFCDAEATDVGYMAPVDIAGRVEVTGRGGTVLQPGIDALEKAKDFPKDGPILVITDGYCEERLVIKREHAFLIPNGRRLPFRAKGKVFYMENKDKMDDR